MKLSASGMVFFGKDVQRILAYLYANDGLLTLNQAARLQRYFYALTDMFDSASLHTNVSKTRTTDFKCQHHKLRCLWIDYYYDLPLFWS